MTREIQELASRHVFRQRQRALLLAAMEGAVEARRDRDWPGAIKSLRAAMSCSDAMAKETGVLRRDHQVDEVTSVIIRLIEVTDRIREERESGAPVGATESD